MYLDFLVRVPTVKGKIARRKKSNVVYIEYDRVYDPSRKYTFPKRVTIGKLPDTDSELMKPNQNFLKYFPDAELTESKNRTSRSSCLRVGTYFVRTCYLPLTIEKAEADVIAAKKKYDQATANL